MNLSLPSVPYYAGFDGDEQIVAVDTIEALRQVVNTPDFAIVKEYASGTGRGGGWFRKVPGSYEPRVAGVTDGDDDLGMAIVNAKDGSLYVREFGPCLPEHFGVTGASTLTQARASMDQYSGMKRWLDFWGNPYSSPTYGDWPVDLQAVREFHAHDLFYRCEQTLDVTIPFSSPSWYGSKEHPLLDFHGSIFTPYELEIPAAQVDVGRTRSAASIKLRMFKDFDELTGKVAWNSKPFPTIYDNPDAYPAWQASGPAFLDDLIKHTIGSGETILYRVATGGTLSGSAPTHSTGTAANGSAALEALGSITTAAGYSSRQCLQRSRDIGCLVVHSNSFSGLDIQAQNYEINLALVPKNDKDNSIGWSRMKSHLQLGCRVGVLQASFAYDEKVDSQAEMLALTDLPLEWVVRRTDDATNDWVFKGPAGGELLLQNWQSRPADATENWSNHNKVEMGLTYGRSNGSIIDTDKSVYGVVITGFGIENATGPNGNVYEDISVEFGDQSGDAEQVQVIVDLGWENEFKARNDSETKGTAIRFIRHAHDLGVTSTPLMEPRFNLMHVRRAGQLRGTLENRRDRNNGQYNQVIQIPGGREDEKIFSVPMLVEDAVFSGDNRVYFDKTGIWDYYSGDMQPYANYRSVASEVDWLFHADDLSFDVTVHEAIALYFEIPHNPTGSAWLEIEQHFSVYDPVDNNDARWDISIFDPATGQLYTEDPSRPHKPITPVFVGVIYQLPNADNPRYRSTSNITKPEIIGFEPWVKRGVIKLWGNRMLGYTVRLRNAWNGSLYTVGATRMKPFPRLVSKPERGIYQVPFDAAYINPSVGKSRTRLAKPDGDTDYYAVSDLNTNIGSPTEYQWAHDGSGNIVEYSQGSWNQIATAQHVLPSDFVDY